MDQIEAYCEKKLADEEVMNLLKIEVYVCAAAFLVLFLLIFGSIRRRSYNCVLKFSVWTAYVLSAYLITYTLGMMESFPFSNEMMAVWAVFLVIFFGSADSISVYSIEDNETRKRYNWNLLVMFFWIAWLILWHGLGTFKLPLLLLLVLTAMKTDERARAMMFASKSQGLMTNPKQVADFMRYEHELSNSNEVNPARMKGYHYLVLGEKDKDNAKDKLPHDKKRLDITNHEVITVDKIWQCKEGMFSSDGDQNRRLKDICLSFALFKLLCRKFAGYPWYECSEEKTWRFVREGLLSKEGEGPLSKEGEGPLSKEGEGLPSKEGERRLANKEGDDHERAFWVIERELAFLYDLLYTKYAVIFRHKVPIHRIVAVLIVGVGCFIGLHIIRKNHAPKAEMTILTSNGNNMDYRVTGFVIFAILFMEVLQLAFIVFSDWSKVMLVSNYVQRPAWRKSRCIEEMIRLVGRVDFLIPWERKLGQYSLLQSFDYNPCVFFYNNITASYIDVPRKGQKESSRIKLPDEVKKAVIRPLKTSDRRLNLSNGVASLRQNKVDTQFSWACDLKFPIHDETLSWACKQPKLHAKVILVWHIATSLCEYKLRSQAISSKGISSQPMESDENFKVADSLSKYCAYLVAFHPRFLPQHANDTEIIFDQVVREARDFLKKCKPYRRRCKERHILEGCKPYRWRCKDCRHICEPYTTMCEELTELEGEDEENIVKCGAKLGNILIREIEDQKQRWKILADFWVEMMLFVSPSDDATIHAERLAMGGEFITHLWALLAHAGVVKRDDDNLLDV